MASSSQPQTVLRKTTWMPIRVLAHKSMKPHEINDIARSLANAMEVWWPAIQAQYLDADMTVSLGVIQGLHVSKDTPYLHWTVKLIHKGCIAGTMHVPGAQGRVADVYWSVGKAWRKVSVSEQFRHWGVISCRYILVKLRVDEWWVVYGIILYDTLNALLENRLPCIFLRDPPFWSVGWVPESCGPTITSITDQVGLPIGYRSDLSVSQRLGYAILRALNIYMAPRVRSRSHSTAKGMFAFTQKCVYHYTTAKGMFAFTQSTPWPKNQKFPVAMRSTAELKNKSCFIRCMRTLKLWRVQPGHVLLYTFISAWLFKRERLLLSEYAYSSTPKTPRALTPDDTFSRSARDELTYYPAHLPSRITSFLQTRPTVLK
ncbi:hypothetical protein P691DRAFT_790490 [Macrolepiota fuliginosa MF-IS2]|uniref:Uncharacterized protein n=1 Tax=Macrolepiota fuliginosa MF-IS2 TaxID=1400762 RepID=A0A9P6BXW4_9AGAR|nr:hypothetical protein P691DRAFT_790490 [Macrolepiota fuliginosa MF-IS2]